MSNWVYLLTVECVVVCLLLFALLTACVVRWRQKTLAISVSAVYALIVFAILGWLIYLLSFHLHSKVRLIWDLMSLLIALVVMNAIGFAAIVRFGWRRGGGAATPAAANWPRLRLLLAVAVAVVLNLVTHWNVKLAVRQRLAREGVEASVRALSVMPGRPLDSENAAILYEPVFHRLATIDEELIPKDWGELAIQTDVQDPRLSELIAKYERELRTLVRAAERPHCYIGPISIQKDAEGKLSEFNWVGPFHRAAGLLAVDARVKLAKGDLDGAAVSTAAVFRMARHAEQHPTLTPAMVSLAVDRLAIECLQALLKHPDLSADVLNRLVLDANVNFRRTLKRAWIMEDAFYFPMVRWWLQEGPGDFGEEGRERVWIQDVLWTELGPYIIEHDLKVLRSTYRDQRAAFDLPWPELSERLAKIADEARGQGPLTSMFLPAAGAAFDPIMIGDARHRLARLAIALRRYELEHGTLPDSFDELVPSFIDEVPLDPVTDKPFKMEAVEGGERLYSAGVESLDREDPKTKKKVKAEMFLKSRESVE